MTSKGNFKDARLLEALEYIDVDLVGEVAAKLRIEQSNTLTEEPVMTWRTPFKHWKRMLATVACLLLLSAAFPVVSYVLPMIGVNTDTPGGNAGAGSSDVEPNEYGSPYERAIDAYPAGMPAEEIYADVLKGGWVVNNHSRIEAGEDLWLDFLDKVERGEPARILIAAYPVECLEGVTPTGEITIDLREIVFDGKLFTHTGGQHKRIETLLKDFNIFSFEYLVKIEADYNTINKKRVMWVLTHKYPYTYEDYGNELMSNQNVVGKHELIMYFEYENKRELVTE